MVDPVLAVAVVVVLLVVLPVFAYFFPPRAAVRGLRAFERSAGVPVAYAVMSILVAVAVVLTVAVETGEGLGLADVAVAVGGTFGPLFAALGFGNRPAFRRVDAATERPTGSPGQGLVAVTGAARAVGETFDTPDGEALYCSYALQKGRKTHRSTVWQTLAEGERTVPLAVDDGSGTVRVDDERVTVRAASYGEAVGNRRTVDLAAGEPVPDDVAAFLASVGVDSPERVETDHRLVFRVVTPGDVATAVGEHERVTRTDDAFWGITAAAGPAYLFAGSYEDVHSELRKITRWLAPAGVVCTLLGVAGAAWLVL